MVAHHVSVVPTLQLWGYELAKADVPAEVRDRLVGGAERQLAAFSSAGGQVLSVGIAHIVCHCAQCIERIQGS